MQANSDLVIVERHPQNIARVRMARPDRRNAMNLTMRDQLISAFRQVLADENVRCVMLAGDGGDFSVGGDIGWMLELSAGNFDEYHRGAMELPRLLCGAGKPLIAVVEGACAGGGAGLALCCDYVLASPTMKFAAPFLNIGIAPDLGIIYTLIRRIGLPAARRLILQRRVVTANEALESGLVDALHAPDELHDAAFRLAEELAALPARAVAATKQLLWSADGDFEAFLQNELDIQLPLLEGAEFAEGAAAFMQKRKADFRSIR